MNLIFDDEDADKVVPQGIEADDVDGIKRLPQGMYLVLRDGHLGPEEPEGAAGRPGPVIGPLWRLDEQRVEENRANLSLKFVNIGDWRKYRDAANKYGEGSDHLAGRRLGFHLSNVDILRLEMENGAIRFGRFWYFHKTLISQPLRAS